MRRSYDALPSFSLDPGVGYRHPVAPLPERPDFDSPAVQVMTDLKQVEAVTIGPDESIDEANRRMIAHAVRLLLVLDRKESVMGLITATDLLGERPLQFIQKHGGTRRDILVRDIMTPQERLEVLKLDDVLSAKIGHIVATLTRAGRQHALVVDVDHGRQAVRGIFSASQIARQLGTPIQTTEIARTFAEIETALTH